VDDAEAIAGLERLGLTSYEARVFLGLQKLGTATASEVAEVADVPRSQVYGAAERLEERGLVETRQSTPTAYRPVSLEQARTRLLDDLQETGTRTFEYLETVSESRESEEQTEAIWLVEGESAISSRLVELIGEAEERILLGTEDPTHLADPIDAALAAAAESGVDVVVGSAEAPVRDRAAEIPGVEPYGVPDAGTPDVSVARVLLVDDRTILLSVFPSTEVADGSDEIAFWSADSPFAAVLVEVIQEVFLEPFG
jgi:sugar-specific transcriptional regulator TrmB